MSQTRSRFQVEVPTSSKVEGKQGPLLSPAKVAFFFHDRDVLESFKWNLTQGGEIKSKGGKKSPSRHVEPSLMGGRQQAPRPRRQQPPLVPHSASTLGDKQRRRNRFSHQSEVTSFSSRILNYFCERRLRKRLPLLL